MGRHHLRVPLQMAKRGEDRARCIGDCYNGDFSYGESVMCESDLILRISFQLSNIFLLLYHTGMVYM